MVAVRGLGHALATSLRSRASCRAGPSLSVTVTVTESERRCSGGFQWPPGCESGQGDLPGRIHDRVIQRRQLKNWRKFALRGW